MASECPLRMQIEAFEEIRRGHEAPRCLRPVRRHADRDAPRGVGLGVEQPDLRAALVDDATAVAGSVARVEVGMVGVPLQAAAVGQARVQVAHALEVGQEVDAAADPHRAGDVAGQLGDAAEAAVALGVDPQVAGGAAAVALPARRVGGVAADHLRLARAEGKVVHRPERQQLRQPAVDTEREGAMVAHERLAVRADEQDATVGREAAHHRVGAEPGHPPRRTALGRHQEHLRVLLVAADVGQPAAIVRQRWRRRLAQSRRQPPRHAAAGIDRPQVVVADEHDRFAAKRRLAQVAEIFHWTIDLVGLSSRSHWAGAQRRRCGSLASSIGWPCGVAAAARCQASAQRRSSPASAAPRAATSFSSAASHSS